MEAAVLARVQAFRPGGGKHNDYFNKYDQLN